MKLYEISDQFKELEKLEDIDQETLNDTLESLTAEFQDKGVSVAAYFLNMDSDIRELKAAEKRITDRLKAIENRSASLKEYLLLNMQRLDINEISCPEFSVKLRKPQQVVQLNKEAIEGYTTMVTSLKIDKVAIKKALKSGEAIDGASLIDGKVSLIIK